MYYSAVCYRQEGVDVRSCILSLVDLFSHWLSQPLHTHTSTANKSLFRGNLLFLRSKFTLLGHALFQKLKARFHILMLVSCLCDQNDQLSFLGVEVHVTRASSLPKIKLVSTFSCLFRGYATKTTNFGSWGRSSRVATLHTLLSLQWHGSRRLEDVRRNQHQIVGHQIVNRI